MERFAVGLHARRPKNVTKEHLASKTFAKKLQKYRQKWVSPDQNIKAKLLACCSFPELEPPRCGGRGYAILQLQIGTV